MHKICNMNGYWQWASVWKNMVFIWTHFCPKIIRSFLRIRECLKHAEIRHLCCFSTSRLCVRWPLVSLTYNCMISHCIWSPTCPWVILNCVAICQDDIENVEGSALVITSRGKWFCNGLDMQLMNSGGSGTLLGLSIVCFHRLLISDISHCRRCRWWPSPYREGVPYKRYALFPFLPILTLLTCPYPPYRSM